MELFQDSERALPPGEVTVELDPLDPFMLGWLSNQYLVAARFDDALQMAERTLEIAPNDPVALMNKAQALVALGENERALEASLQLRDNPMWGFMHGIILGQMGDADGAREVLDNIEPVPRNVVPLVLSNAAIGDPDEMFVWLEVARDLRLPWYPWLLTWYPESDAYRDDPRMLALGDEIGIGYILEEINTRESD